MTNEVIKVEDLKFDFMVTEGFLEISSENHCTMLYNNCKNHDMIFEKFEEANDVAESLAMSSSNTIKIWQVYHYPECNIAIWKECKIVENK